MVIDRISFNDISIFHSDEEASIFHKLNFTKTVGGKEWLRRFFTEPHSDLKRILGTQTIIKILLEHLDDWPTEITNGTVIMMDKFLDYNLDPIPQNPNTFNSFSYKILHSADYSMVKYSVKHFGDFLRGMQKLVHLFDGSELSSNLQFYVDRIKKILEEKPLKDLALSHAKDELTVQQNLYYGYYYRVQFKTDLNELMEIFSRLEAWYSMAKAVKAYDLHFPDFIEQEEPYFKTEGLYHVLLQQPTPYDLALQPNENFLFLTGANMAGKSTLIKAVGSAVFLAHIGMGVPAKNMKLSLFDGLLSNINVTDNIAKGESYFFNEVQRIKNTVYKINDGKKWLVLIDELFKGTNVQDAMKCSLTVIKGLMKIKNSLFILSTHLYEIGDELKQYPNISFKYFETTVNDDQLAFSYQLKEGISNDRIGYVILRREKVVEMLEKL
ncbi:MutS-related protein [Flavisolibacter ginsenosidimutans]|uniref:DNA mismatch repair protein MutS n=1 Tax=Flavisolibacter ginsenosidimutans TaxID=661481 RepID=A0A5B8UID1_9BACT|nr:DNA mismatch repair protein MutS [Flavisolibacter ginsenosidimutans]QEC55860.1 DNA mismatch repair protein MutS [Flavisolibacter ginsenosidimutans]